jgi:hypothetical protein
MRGACAFDLRGACAFDLRAIRPVEEFSVSPIDLMALPRLLAGRDRRDPQTILKTPGLPFQADFLTRSGTEQALFVRFPAHSTR